MTRYSDSGQRHTPVAFSAALVLLLAGCATTTPPTAPASSQAAAAAPGAASAAAAPTAQAAAAPAGAASDAAGKAKGKPRPGMPPPFETVLKDAQRTDGFLPLWVRDDSIWIEIPKALQDKPFFLGQSLSSGLGERFLLPGLMGTEQVVALRQVGNTVQLVARNLHARGPEKGPLATALSESFSDSLLAAVPLAASPHADSGALLVDARALLGGDIPGLQTGLAARFNLPYSLDRGNSSFTRSRTGAEGTSFTYRAHFAIPKLPPPPTLAPGAKPDPSRMPSPPSTVPDPRSFFLSVAYTLAPLPETPMATRRADPRVGYFTQAFMDFGNDAGGDRETHLIARWRLEKQDPTAAISPPKQPIRVVMDRNIPEKWRPAIRAGILEWNKAFEGAGFRDAIALEQQADDADWETTEGTRMLAVRWFAMEGPGASAVGPRQVDPRTGEILRGAAIIPENWVRVGRTRLADVQPRLPEGSGASAMGRTALHGHGGQVCSLAEDALEQHRFGFDLLVARGQLDPSGRAADAYIADSLKDVTMHEVGHALGLRHNFKGSIGVSSSELRNPAFTARNGVSNSVMDYNALNLPLAHEPLGDTQMTVLGRYDRWAIEWGYREFAPDRETQALAELAERGQRDPGLAFATDEDASGPDPEVNRFDLGNDPLAYARRQLALSRELWTRTTERQLAADDDLTVYRRNLQRVLAGYRFTVPLATRYVGGLHTARATAGANQPLYEPVSAQRQREALDLVVGELFASSSFQFDPRIMRRLGVDQFARRSSSNYEADTDFNLPSQVMRIQRGALQRLMSTDLAVRLASAEDKVAEPSALMSYADVQERLTTAVWSELGSNGRIAGGHIDTLRRNLQREHLRRLLGGVLRPADALTSDVPAVHRSQAVALEQRLARALKAGVANATTRAHLQDAQRAVQEALKAPLVRQGV